MVVDGLDFLLPYLPGSFLNPCLSHCQVLCLLFEPCLSNTTQQERINHIIFIVIFFLTLYLYFQWRLLWRRMYQKRETSVTEREQAMRRREQEMNSCYELEHAVNEVNDVTQQLTLIAYAIVNNFSYYGVKGCALYLRSESDRPSLQANAAVSGRATQRSFA